MDRIELPLPASSLRGELDGGLGGMMRITTPLAASGFSRDALGMLTKELGPLGMAPMATGGVHEEILAQGGGEAAGAWVAAVHLAGFGRHGSELDRHGDARRGGQGVRFWAPDVQPGGVRVSDDERVHSHGLPAGEREHEDGLAAEGGGRAG